MKRNIALIGMPGCGKTTIGRILADKLLFGFVDLDEYIENKMKLNISDIFTLYGENYFREIESKSLKEVICRTNLVISTGGGIVTNLENMKLLKNNAIVFYIERNLNEILKNIDVSNRPLLKDNKNKIFELYKERCILYEKYSDYIIKNDKTIYDAVEKIIYVLEQ